MASKSGLENLVLYLLIGLAGWNIANAALPMVSTRPTGGCDIRKAICSINNGTVSGGIHFTTQRSSDGVSVTGQISGLSPGLHGFHVHEFGDLSNGCTSTGGHYNPTNMDHGAPTDDRKHVGDLGNIEADRTGVADVSIVGDQMRLCGPTSIMGRAIVVHGGQDDLGRGGNEASRNNGNAGARVGCCIIGVAR